MLDREWQVILNEINSVRNLSYQNVIYKIKGKLAKKHLDVYRKWKITKFDINYLFSFRDGYINNTCTLLHICVRYDLGKIVNALLAIEGINVNAVDGKYGATPLYIAVESGYINILGTLLRKGAEVNAVDKKAETPLHAAARNNHIEVVNVLLKNKANVNAINIDKATPLHLAARSGHIAVIRVLLKNGANSLLKDKNAQTPGDLTLNDDIKQLLGGSEERKDCILALMFCTTFFLITPFVLAIGRSELTFILKFMCSIVMVAVTILIALVINIKCIKSQPSAEVDEIQAVGVHYNPRNSEISMV